MEGEKCTCDFDQSEARACAWKGGRVRYPSARIVVTALTNYSHAANEPTSN
jgi:hypothetical protein